MLKFKKNKNSCYATLTHDLKKIIKEQLLKEQDNFCCYCGGKINIKNDSSMIEHIKSKDYHAKLQLDFSNMVCSCLGGKNKRNIDINVTKKQMNKEYPLHCDANKGNLEIPISPHDENCSDFFGYYPTGEIFSNYDKGNETIKILNLNNAKLINLRKKIFEGYNHLDKETLNSELNRLKNRKFDEYDEFFFVAIYFIENICLEM